MAILPGFECSISVEGQVAKEYADNGVDTLGSPPGTIAKVSRYIEVQSAQFFSINLIVQPSAHIHPEATHIWASISFDGRIAGRMTFSMHSVRTGQAKGNWRFSATAIDDNLEIRPFRFHTLEKADPSTGLNAIENMNLGHIDIAVYGFQLMTPALDFDQPSQVHSTLHQKHLDQRGVTLGIKSDLIVRPFERTKSSVTNTGQIKLPWTTHFVFKYRTKASLQYLGVIPPSPEPGLLPVQLRDPTTLTREELLELVNQLKRGNDSVSVQTVKMEDISRTDEGDNKDDLSGRKRQRQS